MSAITTTAPAFSTAKTRTARRARALAQTYAKGFYMGLRAGLYFELDESGRTVTATVTIFRDADMTDAVFSDSLLIDLRYDIPVKTGVTAQQRPAA